VFFILLFLAVWMAALSRCRRVASLPKVGLAIASSWVSRETMLLTNYVLFLSAAERCLLGTLYPFVPLDALWLSTSPFWYRPYSSTVVFLPADDARAVPDGHRPAGARKQGESAEIGILLNVRSGVSIITEP